MAVTPESEGGGNYGIESFFEIARQPADSREPKPVPRQVATAWRLRSHDVLKSSFAEKVHTFGGATQDMWFRLFDPNPQGNVYLFLGERSVYDRHRFLWLQIDPRSYQWRASEMILLTHIAGEDQRVDRIYYEHSRHGATPLDQSELDGFEAAISIIEHPNGIETIYPPGGPGGFRILDPELVALDPAHDED